LGLPVPMVPACIVRSPFIVKPIVGILAVDGTVIVAVGAGDRAGEVDSAVPVGIGASDTSVTPMVAVGAVAKLIAALSVMAQLATSVATGAGFSIVRTVSPQMALPAAHITDERGLVRVLPIRVRGLSFLAFTLAPSLYVK
jgi:hypothetical protein